MIKQTVLRVTFLMITSAYLSGCAGISYVMDNYDSKKTDTVSAYGKNFNIWDVPEQRKMLVSATVGDALGIGVSKGITFGAGSSQQPERIYRLAAEKYLAGVYLQNCSIELIEFVVAPQYEVFYMCKGDNIEKIKSNREENFKNIKKKKALKNKI